VINRQLRARWRDEGFTLVELLIVMSIVIVLTAVALVQYTNSVTRAKEAVLKEDLFLMRKAIDEYYADKNKYPASLQALVEEKYIREVPVDPFTNSADSWRETTAEPDPRNPGTDFGISDVKSGADQTALDGTPYSEW
jgi:general secretion pathway protein G